jgi:uncharacterized protein YcbX
MAVRVAQLWRFRVKSLGGERLERAEIGARGIVGDRQWAMLDVETGTYLTARRVPELLFARAVLTPSGDDVRVTHDDGRPFDDDAALSAWLGRDVRLVHAGADVSGRFENVVDFENEAASDWVAWEGPRGSFHDSGTTQVSLLSFDTIGAWDVRRFRANVVLDRGPEDDLVGSSVQMGDAVCSVVKKLARCVITTRSQPGVERDLDVLRTINRERASCVGVGAVVVRGGAVTVDDAVVAFSPAN